MPGPFILPVEPRDRSADHIRSAVWAFARASPHVGDLDLRKAVDAAEITRESMVRARVPLADFNIVAKACGWPLLVEGVDGERDEYVEGVVVRGVRFEGHNPNRVLLGKLDDGRWRVRDLTPETARETKVSEKTLDRDYTVVGVQCVDCKGLGQMQPDAFRADLYKDNTPIAICGYCNATRAAEL